MSAPTLPSFEEAFDRAAAVADATAPDGDDAAWDAAFGEEMEAMGFEREAFE